MEVILLEKIGRLGQLGDVVNVKNGYARNYLIPQGKAKRANRENLAEFEVKRAELEKRQAELLAEAQAKQEKLEGATITIIQKAGVDGKLFGSVTNTDVFEAVVKSGVDIRRSDVRMPNGPIKVVGEYDIDVALHHDVIAGIKVVVVAAD